VLGPDSLITASGIACNIAVIVGADVSRITASQRNVERSHIAGLPHPVEEPPPGPRPSRELFERLVAVVNGNE